MNSKPGERLLASKVLFFQICGAILNRWWWLLLTILALLCVRLPVYCNRITNEPWQTIFVLLSSVCLLATVISACNVLTNVFNLLRKEKHITNCQIAILCAIGLWIIAAIFILKIWEEKTSSIGFAIIGGILTWIFQDKVKGASAFIDLRRHGLLNLGDWIKVPSLGVDGEIKKVTLTTATVYNWDTTTSTIPMSALQSEHFINLQNMSEGKTYGRKMLQSFTIDSSWIHPIDAAELAYFQSDKHDFEKYLPSDELKEGVLNIYLYRLYLYHWLMANAHVSQKPRLLVRWINQNDSGMVLEVYAFLVDSELSAFEWQQSLIIEHIIASMTWFGLRLYQSPSAFDSGNSSIYMTDKPSTYKMENL